MNTLTRAFTPVLLMGRIVLLGLAAEVANADTIYVCWDGSGDYLTIQAGIDAASDGDEVVVCDGTYTGDGNRDLDFHGKAITVRSTDPDDPGIVATTVLDCQGTSDDPHRGVTFRSGEDEHSVLAGLTIINGYGPREQLGYSQPQPAGGGVFCLAANPTIRKCVFSQNFGYGAGICGRTTSMRAIACTVENSNAGLTWGSGVYFIEASPMLSGCTIQGGSGPGIVCSRYCSPIIADCTIAENQDGGISFGSFEGFIELHGCEIRNNYSDFRGGGIFLSGSAGALIADCAIVGNETSFRGGGIQIEGHAADTRIVRCRIADNSACSGAGVNQDSRGDLILEDCVLSGNRTRSCSSEEGGALRVDDYYGGAVTVLSCLFTGNDARKGGAAYCNSTTSLINCAFFENSASYGGASFGPGMLLGCLVLDNYATRGGGVCRPANVINSTICGNTGFFYGGGYFGNSFSEGNLINSVLWSNDANYGGEQIALVEHATLTVRYSAVEGGAGGAHVDDYATLNWGEGNIDGDPLFVDPDGPDDDPNTWEDNNYHLSPGSPCIDAADNDAVPPDTFDLDEDGDTDEPIPYDLDGNPRFVDDPATEDTGNGTPPIVDMGAYEFQAGPAAFLDIKPGSCPNPLNRNSQGVLPVALVGTEDFDVTQVDLDSLELTRADGIGGSVTPLMGPPGPGIHVEDVATPFDGEPCDCHELQGDGIADLAMKFDTPEMVAVLELEDLSGGASVELVLSGELLDTAHFSATDCVILVPRGPGPGALPAQSGPEGNGIDAVPEPAPAPRPADPDAAQDGDAPDEMSPQAVGCGVLPPGFLLTATAAMYVISRARPVAGRLE